MSDAVVQQVSVANRVNGGNNDVLHFGVFVSQEDVTDGVIPVNPASFSFKLSVTVFVF